MGESRTALVTGSAGFIGYFIGKRLLADGFRVVGIDSLSDYYDPNLKRRRQAELLQNAGFSATNEPIETPGLLADLFAEHRPDVVVHLAAQAGVRYSIDNPRSYLESNLVGTFELLEAARAHPPQHMLLASTSSAYGANTEMPYRETMKADHQMSFYAATKKASEAMAHSYAHLFGLPVTMFRFFTVYGPWGRPDMALFKFTRAMLAGEKIDVYNHGEMMRDFTYVEDLVEAVRRLIDTPPVRPTTAEDIAEGDSLSPVAPFRVVNIGGGKPTPLMDYVAALERAMGVTAQKRMLPMQMGDVRATDASPALLHALVGEIPATPLDSGVQAFWDWYRDYCGG